MRVLVLNPPRRDGVAMGKEGRCTQGKGAFGYVMPPLTMVTVATALRREGHDATVLDAVVRENDLARMVERVGSLAPEVVVFNTSTPTIEDDLHAVRLVRERLGPGVATVAYGIHVSVFPEEALLSGAGLDACVVGEPEETLLEVVRALAAGAPLSSVDGLAYLGEGGAPARTPPRPPMDDLDLLPLPDWSLVDTGDYRLPFSNRPFLLVAPNRGCPYDCTFCNAHVYYGKKFRKRSVGHLLAELKSDVERFGVSDLMFWAEEFVLDRAYVRDVCRGIVDSGLDVRWVCNSRVDAVDEPTVRSLVAAGCWNIAFGIESGVQEILDRAGKGITLDETRRAVEVARRGGLRVTGHVILGLPGETAETMEETARFVASLGLDYVQCYCATPFPGSALHEEAVREGWLASGDFRRWEQSVSVLDLPGLPGEEVMKARRSLLLRHYASPSTVAAILGEHVRTPADVVTLAKNALSFARWTWGSALPGARAGR